MNKEYITKLNELIRDLENDINIISTKQKLYHLKGYLSALETIIK